MQTHFIAYGRTLIGLAMLLSSVAEAQDGVAGPGQLRWMYEIRAGYLKPELELFSTFYGDDTDTLISFAGGYRLNNWLEVGAEYGRMRAKGVGLLTSTQTLGGTVRYRLNPFHIYSNLMLQRHALQRVVPYLGVGVTTVRYDQAVEGQGSSSGKTDVGYTIRVGLRVLVVDNSRTSRTPWIGYLLAEAGETSTEAQDIDLGGKHYLLGFRVEFDLD